MVKQTFCLCGAYIRSPCILEKYAFNIFSMDNFQMLFSSVEYFLDRSINGVVYTSLVVPLHFLIVQEDIVLPANPQY